MSDLESEINIRHLSVEYDGVLALADVSLRIRAATPTTLLGGANSGKTTLLRALNRLHRNGSVKVTGSVELRGEDIYGPEVQLVALRKRVAMVFSTPQVFPGSIQKNVAYGLALGDVDDPDEVLRAVETSLRAVGLWTKVGSHLDDSPEGLSHSEQQLLCVARALAPGPEVLLLDDPAKNFDPLGRRHFEELLPVLRARAVVVLATRDIGAAARFGGDVAFLAHGRLVESGSAEHVLSRPSAPETVAYVAAFR